MTMSDPIADMLTRIRNGNVAKHDTVDVPSSKEKLAIAEQNENAGQQVNQSHDQVVLEKTQLRIPGKISDGADQAESHQEDGQRQCQRPGRYLGEKDQNKSGGDADTGREYQIPFHFLEDRHKKTSLILGIM